MNLVEYTYLGLDTIVRANYTGQPGVELTYLKQGTEGNGEAGDQYAGLDRFGRVVDQRWLKTSTGTPLERIQYGFDRTGNRTFRDNRVAASGQDEYYTYDGLNQVKTLQRGDLNANRTGISGTPLWEEDFNYDPTGNWHGSTTAYRTKTGGTTELDHNRTHNKANELTGVCTSVGPGWVAPVHDRAGNMTTIPQPNAPTTSYACTYDAWNRLVKVMDGQNTVATYQYDGQNRRTKKIIGNSTRHFYYSDKWQVLEERVGDATTAERQFVWGQRHVDDLVLRDRGTERLYVLHDSLHVTAVTDDENGAVQQRYGYDAFGTPRVMNPDWTTSNPTPTNYEWETRFGGYRWDQETGLYHVRNRHLHQGIGRWISRDPLTLWAAVPLYVYGSNSPATTSDRFGLLVTAEECNKAMDTALKKDTLTIQLLSQIVDAAGRPCPRPAIYCDCCDDRRPRPAALYTSAPVNEIRVCIGEIPERNDRYREQEITEHVAKSIRHELVHAIIACKTANRSATCEESACEELLALCVSRECEGVTQKEQCLKRVAVSSVQKVAGCRENASAFVDAAWKKGCCRENIGTGPW